MEYKEFFNNKVVLVTGGAGAIGSNLVKKLITLNCRRIVILDNLLL
ncbi:MAG: polysaccharide biosynthesis protein [Bacteroidia bacterium]|nr:polysaccharide biosynthesis protein [Bacteroidia bacterium]